MLDSQFKSYIAACPIKFINILNKDSTYDTVNLQWESNKTNNKGLEKVKKYIDRYCHIMPLKTKKIKIKIYLKIG